MLNGFVCCHKAEKQAYKERQQMILACKRSGIHLNSKVKDFDGFIVNGIVKGWDEDGYCIIEETFTFNNKTHSQEYNIPYFELEKIK